MTMEFTYFSVGKLRRNENNFCKHSSYARWANKQTEHIGKSQGKVWAGSPLEFLLLGVWIYQSLCNASVLHSHEKDMSQAPTSPGHKPLLRPAPCTSHRHTGPAGTVAFCWALGLLGVMVLHFEHNWGPQAILRSLKRHFLHFLAYGYNATHGSWAQGMTFLHQPPSTRYVRLCCLVVPAVSPVGEHPHWSLHAEMK